MVEGSLSRDFAMVVKFDFSFSATSIEVRSLRVRCLLLAMSVPPCITGIQHNKNNIEKYLSK